MRTRLYIALLLIGYLLLTACSGGDSAGETGTTNCTLGTSALDSCTLK